ncbi:MAG TPA: EamA family transporter [Chroococcales cyanobacterium]
MVSQAKRAGSDITCRSVQLAGTQAPASLETSTVHEKDGSRTKLYVALSYIFCCLVWGTTWYAMRVSVQPNGGYPPNFAAAIRFVIAVVLYVPIWFVLCRKSRRPTLAEVGWLSLAGTFNGLYQSFIYSSETAISGGLAAVISAMSPVMVALIAMGTGVEKVSRATLLGFCACFFGVALVSHDRIQVSPAQAMAVLFVLIAAFFNSCSNVTLKGKCTGLHPVVSAMIFLTATDVPVWIGSVLSGERYQLWPISPLPMAAIVYMAIASSIMAFSLYLYMIKHISLMAISTMPFILPVLALIVDLFLERSCTLSAETWTGIAVVLGGVVFSVLKRER